MSSVLAHKKKNAKGTHRPDNKLLIGRILNSLAGKFSANARKKGKGAKTGTSHDWRSFYLSQYDWLKGNHMTKVVLWRQILPIEKKIIQKFKINSRNMAVK